MNSVNGVWEEIVGDVVSQPERLYSLSQDLSDDRLRRIADHICLGNELYTPTLRRRLENLIGQDGTALIRNAIRQIEFSLYIELARRSRLDRRRVKVLVRDPKASLHGTGFSLIDRGNGLFAQDRELADELHAVVFNGFSFNLPAATPRPVA